MEQKYCPKCGKTKPLDEFYKSKLRVQSHCKDCCKAHGRLRNGTTGIYKKQVIMKNILHPTMSLDNCSIVFVTPDMAREFLANQRDNRPVKKSKVYQYKRDMMNGRWKPNYVPLLFDKHGRMGDGQHRCIAVCESGIGQWFLIVKNVDDDVFPTIDIGSVRTPGDIFRLSGIQNSNNIAAMIKNYIKTREHTDNNSFGGGKAFSTQELMDVYDADKNSFDNALEISSSCYRKSPILSISYLAAIIYYLIHDLNHVQEDVEDFCGQLFFRKNVSMTVIDVLYDKLNNERVIKAKGQKTMTEIARQLYLIKTWNAFVQKRDMTKLQLNLKYEKNLWFV